MADHPPYGMSEFLRQADESGEAPGDPTAKAAEDGWEWATVEVFGHRRHSGRTREEERFGAKMLRIDVPIDCDPAGKGWATIYYGGASIFSYALITEEAALKANKPYAPPARYTLTHNEDGEGVDGLPF